MKWRYFCGVLSLVILLFTYGCTVPNDALDNALKLEDLKSEKGTYEYARYPIGTSKEDVEGSGAFDQKVPVEKLDSIETYTLKDPCEINGEEAVVKLEFNSNSLELVHFYFHSNMSNQFYDSLSNQLKEKYGEPSLSTENDTDLIKSSVQAWNSDNSGFSSTIRLRYIQSSEDPLVVLSVGMFEPADENP